ncbi:MAG: deoxyribodipyrimidine photo-lyase [Planctomycetota bacterium]
MRNLFWFRHDLRLADNTGFFAACRAGDVVPCVILDDAFLKNPNIGPNRCALFVRAVASLAADLKKHGSRLILRHGKPEIEIPRLLKDAQAHSVFCNRDYEPYAVARDQRISAALAEIGSPLKTFKDLVIFERGEIRTQTGGLYTVYTPFKKTWLLQPLYPSVLPFPEKIIFPNDLKDLHSAPFDFNSIRPESDVPVVTESSALTLLKKFLAEPIFTYAETRDLPAVEGTSRLSPHLKFGTISPRTVFAKATQILNAAKSASHKNSIATFISELVWRDFFFQIMAEHPRVATNSFRAEYDTIKWENSPKLLEAWKAGRTGYPIVDAGMRQLAQTGWMHNRVRMIVGSFLCKDLLIDWREGERHFARLLIDGEPAVNNGNWQWVAGTGTDAQPYFRIFNPVSQSERFDPSGTYIRRWVPELTHVLNDSIHSPWDAPLMCPDYPARIIDHAERRIRAVELYKAARGSD